MANLFIRKPIERLIAQADDSEKGLKRTLTAWSLILLGIGAIIGAGLFVRTAAAAANNAGPSVTLAFVVAGVGCALAGLCYAEFASMIPIAGSAYTYSYATMGEFIAWIIGWDLVLEYALGAATVSIAWSEYLNKFLGYMSNWMHKDLVVPYEWCHSPFERLHLLTAKQLSGFTGGVPSEISEQIAKNGTAVIKQETFEQLPAGLASLVSNFHGIMNLPALFILLVLTLILIRGMRESALVNGVIVTLKVVIVLLVIGLGWQFINPANHHPYIPDPQTYIDNDKVPHNFGGIMGILGAAGVVFFAFIGFDAVSTAAQEAKNPKRDMPIGILGSLAVCTVLYILFSYVLTGLASTQDFRTVGKEASVAFAITKSMPGFGWLAKFVTVAILAGFSSVILVMLMGQSRVFYSMSRDGLVPKVFSDVHPKFRTPYKSNWIFFVFVGLFAAFVPGDIVGDMTSIGTLFAFILVCAGVWRLRRSHPDLHREFKTPLVPIVPILGILVCAAMIFGLGWPNWLRLGVWLIIGLVIYFGYSIRKSELRNNG